MCTGQEIVDNSARLELRKKMLRKKLFLKSFYWVDPMPPPLEYAPIIKVLIRVAILNFST